MFRFEVNIVDGRMLLNLVKDGVAVCFDIDPQEGQALGLAISETLHPSLKDSKHPRVMQAEGQA